MEGAGEGAGGGKVGGGRAGAGSAEDADAKLCHCCIVDELEGRILEMVGRVFEYRELRLET